MSDKTLYLSDLDGTLLQNDASLSPFAVRELNRMIEKGLCFSISSARSTNASAPVSRGEHEISYPPCPPGGGGLILYPAPRRR